MSHLQEITAIDTNIFCTNLASGGPGGNIKAFITLDKGAVMTKIKAWKEGWRIRGVEMTMSNGDKQMFGTPDGEADSFDISLGETVTRLLVQASGETDTRGDKYHRLGAIWMQTNKGREWGIWADKLKNDIYRYDMPNSGIVVGMFGRSGADVDCLGFAVLKPIDSVNLMDVRYPNLDLQPVSKNPTIATTKDFRNETSMPKTYTLIGQQVVNTERSWSVETGFESSIHGGVNVSAGIPVVTGIGQTPIWKVKIASSYSRSTKKTKEHEWQWPIPCPPSYRIHAEGLFFHDNIETEYNGHVNITLTNGQNYQYSVHGIYKGMNVERTALDIQMDPI